MRNDLNYWYKRYIKDGLKAMKLVVGLGISVVLANSVNFPLAILFFAFVLLESLIERN